MSMNSRNAVRQVLVALCLLALAPAAQARDLPVGPRMLQNLRLRSGFKAAGMHRPPTRQLSSTRRRPSTGLLRGLTVLGRATASETGQWALASATLGAAESTYIATRTTPLLAGIQRLGFVGGAGLTWTALRDMRAAKSAGERLDAAGDLAWGIEGMLEFSPIFTSGAGKLAPLVGTIGGICQTGVGLRRVWQGCRQRDWGKVKLGALDVASGGLWLAWDLFGVENPVTISSFVGLMIGREVYANRQAIGTWGKRVGHKVGQGIKRGWRKVRTGGQQFGRRIGKLRDNMLHRLGRGLDRPQRPQHRTWWSAPARRPAF